MKKLLGYLLVIVGIVIMVDSKLEFFNIPFPYLIGSVVADVGLGLSAMGGEDSYARFKEQYEAETGEQLSCPLCDLEVVWSDKDGNRWIVILDDRGFPFGDLYWVSENGIQISRNSLWDKMNLFGAWVVLSDVALNCTYDVRGYPKGLSAMIEVTACDDALRYVCRVSEAHRGGCIDRG